MLYNYLEGSSAVKIPWDDLRYIFGEIMYGGHIVDDWDRRMSQKYLLYFMRDELLDEIDMIPYAETRMFFFQDYMNDAFRYTMCVYIYLKYI